MFSALYFALICIGWTDLLVNAAIFEWLRNFLISHAPFFGNMISCMICTGFWVGFILGIFFCLNPFFSGAVISLLCHVFSDLVEFIEITTYKKSKEVENEG